MDLYRIYLAVRSQESTNVRPKFRPSTTRYFNPSQNSFEIFAGHQKVRTCASQKFSTYMLPNVISNQNFSRNYRQERQTKIARLLAARSLFFCEIDEMFVQQSFSISLLRFYSMLNFQVQGNSFQKIARFFFTQLLSAYFFEKLMKSLYSRVFQSVC